MKTCLSIHMRSTCQRPLLLITLPLVLLIMTQVSVRPIAAQESVTPTGPVEKVEDGFAFTEGPAWADDGALYFTDIPNATIHQLDHSGEITAFVKPSGHANGLLVDGDRLLACQMDGQMVAYDRESKKMTVLASEYDDARFNAPNDLVQDSQGGVYFTDPFFRAPEPLPQKIQAVYYIPAKGEVQRVTEGLPAPNGVGLSRDGKSLYVVPTQSSKMLVYPVLAPGKLGEPKTFCELKQPAGKENTGGDGMAIDDKGNLYITSQIGVQIFSPEGEMLGNIEVPEQPSNVTFGGEQRKTLYITARTGLYSAAMPHAGLIRE